MLINVAEKTLDWVKANREWIKADIVSWIERTVDVGSRLMPILEGIKNAAGSFIDTVVRGFNIAAIGLNALAAKFEVVKNLFKEGHQFSLLAWGQGSKQFDDIELQMQALTEQGIAGQMQAVQQLPGFWQTQLNAITASNAFSMATIVKQGTGAFAQWVVQGTSFKQFFVGLQTTLVQAVAQFGVQKLALLAANYATELGLTTGTEAAKNAAESAASTGKVALATGEAATTATTTAGETARMGISVATNKVIMGGRISTLGGIAAVGNAAMATLGVVVTTTSSVLAGMGAALAASVFGAPFAPGYAAAAAAVAAIGGSAIAAGMDAIQAALGTAIGVATAALATPFASGGIATSPTFGAHGRSGLCGSGDPLKRSWCAVHAKRARHGQ